MNILKILPFLLLPVISGYSQMIINHKGTKLQVDSSKWSLSSTNIYNKNSGTVGIGTSGAADNNAALEVKATNKGMLIPRVSLSSKNNFSPLTAHVAGMLVYNTATAGTPPNNVSPGFYYNTGMAWARVMEQVSGQTDTTNDSWKEYPSNTQVRLAYLSNGSTARTTGTEFVIEDDGKVGIGTTNPSWLLDVQGASAIGQLKRIGGTSVQAPGFLFTRALGSVGSESDINAGSFLGKIQFRGRLSGTDADYASIMYVANATSAGSGRFGFTKSNLTTEVMSITTDNSRVGIGATAPNSTLQINGSLSASVINISSATTLDDTHCYVIAGTNAAYTITLPAANTCEGRVYHIKVNGTGAKTTSPAYISAGGSSSSALTSGATTTLVSNGNSWYQF